MNSEDIRSDRLLISNQQKMTLLNHIRTDFAQLWSLSLVSVKLSESNLLPLKNIAALEFLDISFSKIALEALIPSIRQIQIMEFHYFNCFDNFPDEITRGFLVKSLSNAWSLNGVITNCIERSHWDKYFDDGPGRFSEIYRKHFVHHLEFVHSNEPIIWSDRAKKLMGATTSEFTMVTSLNWLTLGV
jgi:hypothetical protein